MRTLFSDYLDALLIGDRATCRRILVMLRNANTPIMSIYEDYFKKSLYKVGEFWEYNKISVAVEHMATAITEGLMNEMFAEIIAHDRKGKKTVIACVEQEEHQVGGKMVADVFEKNGWDSFYLGANTPTNELLKFCELTEPNIICLSLAVYTNVAYLIKEIKLIRKTLDTPIFIGGQAIRNNGSEIARKFNNVHYFADLYAIENYIKGEH